MINYTFYIGNTPKLDGRLYDDTFRKYPFELTDFNIIFHAEQIKDGLVGSTLTKQVGAGINIIDETQGHFQILFSVEDTELLGENGGVLLYTITAVGTSGEVYTLQRGKITLKEA